MDAKTAQKTEALAPILRMIDASNTDWKDVSCRILTFLGMEELSYVLLKKRQDWQAIGETLQPALQEDKGYQRSVKILNAIGSNPLTLEQLATATGFHKMTISQTLNSLERAGISFEISYQQCADGSAVKAWAKT